MGRRNFKTGVTFKLRQPAFAVAIAIAAFATNAALAESLAQAQPNQDAGEGARIHLRGCARIDAHPSQASGKLVLGGTLTDDGGQALARERVTVWLSPAATPSEMYEGFGPRAASAPELCVGASSGVRQRDATRLATAEGGLRFDAPHRLTLTTDDGGRFCFRTALPIERYVAHVASAGSPWLDAASLDVPIDMTRRALTLQLTPEPRIVDLDARAAFFDATATVDDRSAAQPGQHVDDEASQSPAASIALAVGTERDAALGIATTDAAGHARFVIDPRRLGPPGKGELRLTFDGNADIGKSAHVAEIERRTKVVLAAPSAPNGTLAPGAPDEGVAIAVVAKTTGGDAVPSGSVEALLGASVVGAAPVEGGEAHLVVTFAPSAAASVPLRIVYVSDAPWFAPGGELAVTLPLRGPSPWQNAPLLAAGLAVIAWLMLGRRASILRPVRGDAERKPASLGVAKIDVVRSVRSARAGWTGRIVDAHEGFAIAGARVAIERAMFSKDGRGESVASALANDAGRFELRSEDAVPGDELSVEAPMHASLRRPLPAFGELEIALVLRKRALLDRLVAWARKRGRPYDARPEPTPGHVRRAAGDDFLTARWADAVERAAFGPGDVDGRVEAEVDRLAPGAPVAKVEGDAAAERARAAAQIEKERQGS